MFICTPKVPKSPKPHQSSSHIWQVKGVLPYFFFPNCKDHILETSYTEILNYVISGVITHLIWAHLGVFVYISILLGGILI